MRGYISIFMRHAVFFESVTMRHRNCQSWAPHIALSWIIPHIFTGLSSDPLSCKTLSQRHFHSVSREKYHRLTNDANSINPKASPQLRQLFSSEFDWEPISSCLGMTLLQQQRMLLPCHCNVCKSVCAKGGHSHRICKSTEITMSLRNLKIERFPRLRRRYSGLDIRDNIMLGHGYLVSKCAVAFLSFSPLKHTFPRSWKVVISFSAAGVQAFR